MMTWMIPVISLLCQVLLVNSLSSICPATPECNCVNQDVMTTAACHVIDIKRTVSLLPESVNIILIDCIIDASQELADGTFQHFENLTEIHITSCNIAKISRTIFENTEAKILQISKSELDTNALSLNSSYITRLDISESSMASFPDLQGLPNLRVLNISHNNLKDFGNFESDCVSLNLTHLDLSGNNFKKFPSIVNCTAYIKTLNYVSNPPVDISSDIFVNAENLEILNMDETVLTGEIPNISDLQELTTLKLEGNGQTFTFNVSAISKLRHLKLETFRVDSSTIMDISSLTNLTTLYLPDCGLEDIPMSFFVLFHQLTELDLSRNKIRTLYPGQFDTLSYLINFNISRNELTRVADKVLTPSSLKILDLSDNYISYLGYKCFHNLTNIRWLNMSFNNISYIPRSIFTDLKNVENLFLKRNKIVSLPDFRSLGNLMNLDLKDNRIVTITDNTFKGLWSMTGISLRNNSIMYLPTATFMESPSLYYLDLAHNSLQGVSHNPLLPTPWGNISQITFLRLDYNKIKLYQYEFAAFRKLESLFLDHNLITYIDYNMFPSSLKLLELSVNRIGSVSGFLTALPNLQAMNLQFNYPYLRKLSSSCFWTYSKAKPVIYIGSNEFICDCNLQWLKSLSVPNTTLSFRLKRMANFADLENTFCANNGPNLMKLEHVPMEYFSCLYSGSDFECLFDCTCCAYSIPENCSCAYYCPDGCVCNKARKLFKKNEIMCENRNFSTVPLSFPPDSTSINLHGNNLSAITQGAFSNLTDLIIIDLSFSGIETVADGSFLMLPKLEFLFLDHNKIASLSAHVFDYLPSLTVLHLNNNKITQVPASILLNLPMLNFLALHNNYLKDFRDLSSYVNRTSVNITLSTNPWTCDCGFMDAFLDFVTVNARKIYDIKTLACESETNSTMLDNGTVFENATDINSINILDFDYHLICSNKTIIVNSTEIKHILVADDTLVATIISLSVVFAGVICMGIILVWKRHFVQVVIYNKLGVRIVPVKEVEPRKEYKYDAFVSYSSQDENFVVRELMPKLEREKTYRLCLHFRDFPVGEYIADNIIQAVDNSRKTLLVLSNDFLASEWCKFEFQTAHHIMLTEHADNILVIIKEKLNDELLDADLKEHLKSRTFLEYTDPWFWEKLYFALPDAKNRKDTEDLKEDVNGQIEFNVI